MPIIELQPYDTHNQRLESNVHPSDWQNPTPDGRYNLVVIGAGTAGLVTAAVAAGLGGKVALIERNLMGGDCLNVGCVPSKAIIAASRVAASVREAGEMGIHVPEGVSVDFAQVMERMRKLRADISPADSARKFSDEKGVEVFIGDAEFIDSETVAVGDLRLKFTKAVIATGARAAAPPINGLESVEHLTNESVFSLTELPDSLGVIGAGPIGCELAQAMARFGTQVHLVNSEPHVLPREDADAAAIVQTAMLRDGVKLYGHGRDVLLSPRDGQIGITANAAEGSYDLTVDKLLVAVGRAPNVDGLGLEKVGVEFDKRKGVQVNDRLQTTNPKIYAAGDICSPYKFTHAADFMARTVVRNALFKGRSKVSSLVIPWATYTSPELAHVGLTEATAKEQGTPIDTYRQDFADVDRAILEGETEGFVKIHTEKGKDKIVGGTIVHPNAGDMISSLSIAMTSGIGLGSIGSAIHPYPTNAEAIRKLGDQYGRTKFTPLVASLFKKWLAWTR